MKKISSQLLSLSLMTMPLFVLTVHHGAAISASIIFLLSIWVLTINYPIKINLSNKEKILIFSLLLLPVVIALDVFFRDLRLRYLDYYLRFILVIPIYFALKESKINIMPLFIGILLGSIGAGLFALYQVYFMHEVRVSGYLYPITYGNISLLLGVMSLTGLFLANQVRFRKNVCTLCLLAFLLGVIGSILSGTRGGWLAVPFFIGLFLIYTPVAKRYKEISLLISVAIVIGVYSSNSYVQQRVNSGFINVNHYLSVATEDKLKATQTSAGSRLEMWKAAWLIFKENPIVGVGSGNYSQEIKIKMEKGEIEHMHIFAHAHSEPLHILAITGIIGFTSYLILYLGTGYYFYNTLRSHINIEIKYLSLMGLMVVGGFFIFGLTNYSFGHHAMVLFFAVMVASLAGMIRRIESNVNVS